MRGFWDHENFKAGGKAAEAPGFGIFDHKGVLDTQQFGGAAVGFGIGLHFLYFIAADECVEVLANASTLEHGFDLHPVGGTDNGEAVGLEGGEEAADLIGDEVDFAAARTESGLLVLEGLAEIFDAEARLGQIGEGLEHEVAGEAAAAGVIDVPIEVEAEGCKCLSPIGVMEGFAVDQDAVEIEEDRFKLWHPSSVGCALPCTLEDMATAKLTAHVKAAG